MAEVAGDRQLILGSASPRRFDLLSELGVPFSVQVRGVDEDLIASAASDTSAAVRAIAAAKFAAFDPAEGADVDAGTIVLTADTMVACNGLAMGKPPSDDDLANMLRAMSGQEVHITTAVCVGPPGKDPTTTEVTTTVLLRELSDEQIAIYVATGAGRDKAGGLALQAEAGDFVVSVDGSWSNVLGLPIEETRILVLDALAR